MARWGFVLWGAVLCVLLAGFSPHLGFQRGERLFAAASRFIGTDSLKRVRIGGSTVPTISVDSTAGLVSALKGAQSGDTITLAPGVYSGLTTKGLSGSFDVPVIITSADPSKPAVITDFALSNMHGLTFRNLEFLAVGTGDQAGVDAKYWAFKIGKSSDILFDKVSVHGSLDGDVSNDVFGIQVRDSENISVTNSEFQQLGRALAIGSTDNVKVIGNDAHDLRSDGFDFAEVSNVQVLNNTLRDFFPVTGDHPDAIQFWTSGTTVASHDILISGNLILKGEGQGTQGIFLRDQLGTLPYEHVTISNNLVVGTGYNAIRIQGAKDITLTNNELITFAGDYKSFFLIQGGNGVVAEGNRAVSISFGDSINVKQSGNVTTGNVDDLGAAALKAWLEAHPSRAGFPDDILEFGVSLGPSVPPLFPATPADMFAGGNALDAVRSFFGANSDFMFS